METYKLKKYEAFNKFKKKVGNTNQFLITALVGINKIDESDKGKEVPAPWYPNDVEAAKNRSRDFVKKAGLVWVIDCLDELLNDFFNSFFNKKNTFYKREESFVVCIEKTNKLPSELNEQNKISYERVNRSAYWKFTVISDYIANKKDELTDWRKVCDYRNGKKGEAPYFPELELVCALIDLAIQWRNNLVHSGIDNSIRMNTSRVLNKYAKLLNSNQYGTLDISTMINNFKRHGVMSFKELSVMIRNVIDFGYILNAFWINEVDKYSILQEALSEVYLTNKSEMYSLSLDRQKGYLIMKLGQRGLLEKADEKGKSEEETIIDNFLSNLPRRVM